MNPIIFCIICPTILSINTIVLIYIKYFILKPILIEDTKGQYKSIKKSSKIIKYLIYLNATIIFYSLCTLTLLLLA